MLCSGKKLKLFQQLIHIQLTIIFPEGVKCGPIMNAELICHSLHRDMRMDFSALLTMLKKIDRRLILLYVIMHPTELQTFSLCDTMKCQMTANLHGEHNWEPPHALLFTSELAFASRLLSSFHTCQNVKKTDDDELLGVVFPVFENEIENPSSSRCVSSLGCCLFKWFLLVMDF